MAQESAVQVTITITAGFLISVNAQSDMFVPLDDDGNVKLPISARAFELYCEKYKGAKMADILTGESERQTAEEAKL